MEYLIGMTYICIECKYLLQITSFSVACKLVLLFGYTVLAINNVFKVYEATCCCCSTKTFYETE